MELIVSGQYNFQMDSYNFRKFKISRSSGPCEKKTLTGNPAHNTLCAIMACILADAHDNVSYSFLHTGAISMC